MTTYASPTATTPARNGHTLSAADLTAFERDGYYVARQLLNPAEVAVIRDTFMATAANGPVAGLSETIHPNSSAYDPTDPLARYPRMLHPHRHPELAVGPLAQKYMLDPQVGAILADLFADEPIAAQSMFYFKPAGTRGQARHQDNIYLQVKPGTCMAAWTAIDDTDEENGTLFVVPGSHRLDLVCPEEKADNSLSFTSDQVRVPAGMKEIPVRLRAGDVLFFNGSLIHGSYPNRSQDRYRRSLICHYMPRNGSEISHFYKPLLNFYGQVVERQASSGGGPCGAPAAEGPH